MNRTKQILIIEDDTRIATALAVRLNAAGYEVLTATDGVEGLRLALDHRPNLIVMDIWMPIGLGLSVAQRLQSLGLGNIPIIVMTASKLEGLQQAAEEVGAVAFFEKPYNAEELLTVIARSLDPDCARSIYRGSKHSTRMAA
jgi:CheY-like chemotaxis protein